MPIIPALLAVFWWIAIWGLFDIYTEDKSKNQKIKIYLIMLGMLIAILCFFPNLINRF
jgi:hypothetical protein